MLWALFRLLSGWSGQELGSQFLLCDMCQASRSIGKRFTLYAFRHSYGLERAHGPCFRLLLLPDQYHWCNSKVQTHCSISKFTICDQASTSQCGVTCAKPPTNMTLSDWESSDEDVGQANNNMDNFCRSQFFQWTTPADSRGPEWYRPRFEPVKEASWTFRLQVKGLKASAPGH